MDPKLVSSRDVYTHPIVCLKEDEYQVTPDNVSKKVRFAFPDWVCIIAINEDGEIILVEQFRYGTGSKTIELPGGGIEAGETPEEAGARELFEETGYLLESSIVYVGSCFVNPSCQDNKIHVVYAAVNEGIKVDPEPDEDEELKVIKIPMDRLNPFDNQEIFSKLPSLFITAIGMLKIYRPLLLEGVF